MTRIVLFFSLLVAVAFGPGLDSIAVGQDQPNVYSTKRLKSVTLGQHMNQEEIKSLKSCDAAVVKQPLPFPVRFLKGSTEVAFQVVFDGKEPWPTERFSAKLDAPKDLGEVHSSTCKKFRIRSGEAWVSEVVSTFTRRPGEAFPSGSYKLRLFAGDEKPELEVPFSVE
jgi:hypothetical protein